MAKVEVPDIGDFEDVEVIEVLVSKGDSVSKEDPLITLESDKATMDIPAPSDGTITNITVSVGDRVSQGTVIAELSGDEAASEVESEQQESESVQQPESEPPKVEPLVDQDKDQPVVTEHAPPPTLPDPVPQKQGRLPHASPAIRRFARELGADLSKIAGSGPKGRILKEDVKAWIKQTLSKTEKPAASQDSGIPPIPEIDFSEFGQIEVQTLSRIKKLSGPHLQRSWLNIPHVTHNDEADITELESFRKSLKAEAEKEGLRITILSFVMKALVGAMKKYPNFNASLAANGEELILKKYFNIGIAVDTPNGLVVPVVRDVDRKSIFDLARDLADVSERARDGKLTPTDIKGGCMSISSLGGIGGTSFTPIVNAPEVAILGVSRSKMMPVWNGDEFEPRLILPMSLSYDHRVVDGADAARFCAYLTASFEDVRRLSL